MKIEMKSYQMIIDRFLHMIRSPKLTNEEIGETIATFMYDETIENQVEILNYALFTALRNYKGKKAWEEREARKHLEDDPHVKLDIKDGLVTKVGDEDKGKDFLDGLRKKMWELNPDM